MLEFRKTSTKEYATQIIDLIKISFYKPYKYKNDYMTVMASQD